MSIVLDSQNREEATEKAIILARAAVAKVHLNAPLQPGESKVVKRALVIGGGIAGIQTALDIADAGYEVDIVEKTPSIGGRMSQPGQDLPDPGLLRMYPDPEDGRGFCS